MRISKWEADATSFSEDLDLEDFIFRNPSVNAFISSGNYGKKPFIIAGKGMGKTLLLHQRRHLCEDEYKGAIFLPSIHRYVDFPEPLRIEIQKEVLEKLANFDYCKKFWLLVLKLYVFSGMQITYEEVQDSLTPEQTRLFSNVLGRILKGQPKSISFIINELIDLRYNHFANAIDSLTNSINIIFDNIHTPVCVFLDQLDQALCDTHKPVWITMQNALLEAAWDIKRINKHINIYLSIRKEAYALFKTKNSQIHSSIVQITYDKNDLKEMVNHLVRFYEKKDDLYSFCYNMRTLHNATTLDSEDVFDFMYRYSIGRPRDFVQMCYDLSLQNLSKCTRKQKRDEMKRIICNTAGSKIIGNLFDEQRMLLACLVTEELFDLFLKDLDKNVYTYKEMVNICKKYNGKNCCGKCHDCESKHHPFCDLYNMGLLGRVDRDGSEFVQLFKTPYEAPTEGLIKSEMYLIHPALREYISHLHANYHLVKGILVGQKLLWKQEYLNYQLYDNVLSLLTNEKAKDYYTQCFETFLKNRKKDPNSVLEIPKNIKKNFGKLTPIEQKSIRALNKYLMGGKIMVPSMNIFISYAVDKEVPQTAIDSLRNELRRSGFNAEHYKSLIVKERDLTQLMLRHMRDSDRVIVVLSKTYKKKAEGAKGGVWEEYQMIKNDIEKKPEKYIFVCFGEFDKDTMYPYNLGNKYVISNIRTHEAYNDLVSLITGKSTYSSDISENITPVKQVEEEEFFKE